MRVVPRKACLDNPNAQVLPLREDAGDQLTVLILIHNVHRYELAKCQSARKIQRGQVIGLAKLWSIDSGKPKPKSVSAIVCRDVDRVAIYDADDV